MRKNAAGEFMDIETLIKSGQSVQLYPQGYSMYPLLVPGRGDPVSASGASVAQRRGGIVSQRCGDFGAAPNLQMQEGCVLYGWG